MFACFERLGKQEPERKDLFCSQREGVGTLFMYLNASQPEPSSRFLGIMGPSIRNR